MKNNIKYFLIILVIVVLIGVFSRFSIPFKDEISTDVSPDPSTEVVEPTDSTTSSEESESPEETDTPEETDSTSCKHSYGEIVDKRLATCLNTGLRETTCTKCGYVLKITLEPLGHNYGAPVSYSNSQHVSTCTRYTCGQRQSSSHTLLNGACVICDYQCTHSNSSFYGDTGDEPCQSWSCTLYCFDCGYMEGYTEYYHHDYNANGVCDSCGDVCVHVYEYTSYDDYHTGGCTYCGYSLGSESHTFVNGECSKCGCYTSDSGDSGGSAICTHENSGFYGDGDGCHQWSWTLYCFDCGYNEGFSEVYNHSYTSDGTCEYCGESCPHSWMNEEGWCEECGYSSQ